MIHVDNQSLFIANFVQRLKDQYTQSWAEKCSNTSKLCHYKYVKHYFNASKYFFVITIDKFRKAMFTLSSSPHRLMVEKGDNIS